MAHEDLPPPTIQNLAPPNTDREYFKDGKAKVEIGVARGKKTYDKRQAIARRDVEREVTRELGRQAKGM